MYEFTIQTLFIFNGEKQILTGHVPSDLFKTSFLRYSPALVESTLVDYLSSLTVKGVQTASSGVCLPCESPKVL